METDLDILLTFYRLGNRALFMHNWAGGLRVMMEDFHLSDEDMKGVTVLLADYTYESYEGDAFVLFAKGEKLWEVNASHCSCYGLENTWRPEETTVEGLRHRITEGTLGGSTGFAQELMKVLADLEELATTKEKHPSQ